MAHGISLLMRHLSFRPTEDRPARTRDRSLNGKARRNARKASNRQENRA